MPQISKSFLPTSVSNFVRHFLMFFVFLKPFYRSLVHFFLFYRSLHPVIVKARFALPQNQNDQLLCRHYRAILRLQKPFSRCFCLFSRYLFPLLLIIAQFLRCFVNFISVFTYSQAFCRFVLFHVKHFATFGTIITCYGFVSRETF